MKFLPRGFRRGMSTAYLLARATDTIADTARASGEERLDCLRRMGEVIEDMGASSQGSLSELMQDLRTHFAPNQDHLGERELLTRFDEVVEALRALPKDEARLVRTMLRTIVRGQSLDLSRFDCAEPREVIVEGSLRRLAHEEDLMEYAYLVAGCVGEFWTNLGFVVYGERYARRSQETMLEWGRNFGKGLQLVNILRDRHEDADRGRVYIPEGVTLPDLYALTNRFLNNGIDYARAVRGLRMRFAVRLPAVLGFKTLMCIERAGEEAYKPKITRRDVYASMIESFIVALIP